MNGDIRDRYRGYQQPLSRPQTAPVAKKPEQIVEDRPFVPMRMSKKKRGHKAKKAFLVFLVLLLLGSAGAGGYWFYKKSQPKANEHNPYALGNNAPAATSNNQEPTVQMIRLVATGDMIAHDSINQNAKEGNGYNYTKLMDKMKPFFAKADVRFCNQATPAGGPQFGISGYPIFNAPIEFARGLEEVGCNVINIGTNHANDKGQPLIDATVAAWDGRKILAVAGANRNAEEQKKVRYFEVKGMKFAFVAYTTYSNDKRLTPHGVNMYNDAFAQAQVTEARTQADFVIASVRWGTEYSPDINAEQEKVAQSLANFGVDVIFGHGPHVLEPVKRLKGQNNRETLVWYSIGNFLTSQIDVESLIGGFAVMDIDTSTKKITKISFMPVYMHYEWTAEAKKRQTGADLATRHDFTMVPLDQAAELLPKSQNNTTVQAQTDRVKAVLNKFIEVPIITSSQY